MKLLAEEEHLREWKLYEEMKDIHKLKNIITIKKQIFEERQFKLRSLVLLNLKNFTKMQIKALDEEYHLIGLDEQCWKDEEHFMHDLDKKIEFTRGPTYTQEQEEKLINKLLTDEKNTETLLFLLKHYISLLYIELKKNRHGKPTPYQTAPY